MSIRDHNLDCIASMTATFKISQTASVDDLKDADVGKAVTLKSGNTVGPCSAATALLGKLIALSLTDADNGKRVATVQIGGVCRLPIAATYPVVGNRVIGAAGGAVCQAPVLTGYDPAGGNIARGTVIEVNSTTDCVILLN
jgi:hypothetical protein